MYNLIIQYSYLFIHSLLKCSSLKVENYFLLSYFHVNFNMILIITLFKNKYNLISCYLMLSYVI